MSAYERENEERVTAGSGSGAVSAHECKKVEGAGMGSGCVTAKGEVTGLT